MSSAEYEIYRAVCHCGHHRDTHFKKSEACLGLGCDGVCNEYRDDQKPDPVIIRAKIDKAWDAA